MVDDKDESIIRELERNSKQTTSQLAKRTRIPITTVHNRIKKLEQEGVITGYGIEVDYDKLGLPLEAVILVSVTYRGGQTRLNQEEVAKEIKKLGAHEVLIITGDEDILVRVRAENVSSLNDFVTHKLRAVPGVDKTKTLLVLSKQ